MRFCARAFTNFIGKVLQAEKDRSEKISLLHTAFETIPLKTERDISIYKTQKPPISRPEQTLLGPQGPILCCVYSQSLI